MRGGIYTIFCSANESVYIGQSQNVNERFSQHRCKLRHGDHPNPHLQSAWNKYGEATFTFTVELLESGVEKRDAAEQTVFAAYLQSGAKLFNIRPATATNKGVRFSKETRRKLSEAATKQFGDAEARAKHSMSYRKTAKPCVLLSPEGDLIEFFNPTAFAKERELERGSVLKLLRGRLHSYKDWKNPSADTSGKRSNRLTSKEKAELCKLFASGKTHAELSELFGINKGSVAGLLKRRGITDGGSSRNFRERVASAKELREAGIGTKEIAAQFGVDQTTVQRWLNR